MTVTGVGPIGVVLMLLIAGAVCGHGVPLMLPSTRPEGEHGELWARASLMFAALGGAAATALAIATLVLCSAGDTVSCGADLVVVDLPSPTEGFPGLGLTVRNDGLAALFLGIVGFCGASIAVYSFGWLSGDPLRHRIAGSFNLFLASTVSAVLVANVFWLLVALEFMTLSSSDLLRHRSSNDQVAENRRIAVSTYLIVSHVSLMLIVAGILPAAVASRSFDYSTLAAADEAPMAGLSFVLLLLGFAGRAGMTPFHFWVPAVHPQLPTNTHAMMSAVMLKLPVYLMVRFFIGGMIGDVSWWWGAVVVVWGGLTALVTVIYALLSKDLKIAFAYHSVENIGIIVVGVGLAMMFGDDQLREAKLLEEAAGLALLAALYHVVNHALFKTLLFLGTGSIERQTGTVEPAKLGGLLRRLPWTGTAFLIGALAIAGLPSLNGFVSEWLTLHALFGGQSIYHERDAVALTAMVVVIIAIITLAAAFALTALAIVKIIGESLLGQPRRSQSSISADPWSMRLAQVVLAALCVLLGIQPWLLVPWLTLAVETMGFDLSILEASPTALAIEMPGDRSGIPAGGRYEAVLPTVPLLLLVVLPVISLAVVRGAGWIRRPIWVGGGRFDPEDMQYTGLAISSLFWEPVARRTDGDTDTPPAVTPPLASTIPLSDRRAAVEFSNLWIVWMSTRVLDKCQRFGETAQSGDLRRYLAYILVAVLAVLALVAAVL